MQYHINDTSIHTAHFPQQRLAVSDVDLDHLSAQLRARSGDYLATLATDLDNISRLLSADNEPEHERLQHIVDELLYIDARYTLAQRTPSA